MKKQEPQKKQKTYDTCPHCGNKLSPWQQVLLGVDREIMCKNCWYRIILPVFEDETPDDTTSKPKGE